MNVLQLPKTSRPREKLLSQHPSSLTTDELVAVVLGTGTKQKDVLTLAKETSPIFHADTSADALVKLQTMPGLGTAKRLVLLACVELGRRLYKPPSRQITRPEHAVAAAEEIRSAKREHIIGLYLSSRHELVRKETLAVGSLNQANLHPRDVFVISRDTPCAFVILVHNHPSEKLDPSEEDLAFTRRVILAGQIIGIPLLDHIVVTKFDFLSIKETNASLFSGNDPK
jgi:DNA repair protein RadC